MKHAFLLLLILPALAILAAGTAFWILWAGPGPIDQPKTLIVEQGSSVSRLAYQLEREGLIRGNATTFRGFARLFGGNAPIQAGEFQLRPKMSAAAILTHLQYGRPIQRLVTIPEGMPSVLVHERLMQVPYLTGNIEVPPEGSILPDSYSYRRGESRVAVLDRMRGAMRRELERLWGQRGGNSAVASPEAAIILASIVEKETGKPSERRMVAGVYTNRLRRGMPLQADPTVIYPITRGRPLGRRILRSELNADNGYNTYRSAGLPIGPIANPGRESIAAVLNPAQTNALYFVADGTGGHIFADTLDQHNANVQRWYAIRRARGEM
ncbi:endolytic transglycosylase MltG [Sphingosinicella sp. LHD-64]|uniref:endolytic transglycosylase MltG n=1 Tax=Sphingosinicella sp. LHD-64 TaxID=3072139 RepID=UPI00280E63AC|nr:endolytic transglycosylase MltG [Sphingosinicella sp. LHD-64]MDQ8755531.1 endolytic transglycosylase MltG [Sphingosinicella sp. LHD-64]